MMKRARRQFSLVKDTDAPYPRLRADQSTSIQLSKLITSEPRRSLITDQLPVKSAIAIAGRAKFWCSKSGKQALVIDGGIRWEVAAAYK
jgi:hypothetical protein